MFSSWSKSEAFSGSIFWEQCKLGTGGDIEVSWDLHEDSHDFIGNYKGFANPMIS